MRQPAKASHSGRRGLARALGMVVALGLLLGVPARAQDGQGGSRKGEGRRAERGQTVELVVDGTVRRTLGAEDLRRLATERWLSPGGRPHPAIPLLALLREAGVEREAVTAVRIRGGAQTVALAGADLARLDQLLLRTGQKAGRPWRLVPREPSAEVRRREYRVGSVRRIETGTAPR